MKAVLPKQGQRAKAKNSQGMPPPGHFLRTFLLTLGIAGAFGLGGFALDRFLALGLMPLYQRTLFDADGDINKINWALLTKADAYVFGDSRARQHYDTRILRNGTGLQFFNAGVTGRDFVFMNMLRDLLEQQHKARLYLVDINYHGFDQYPFRYKPDLKYFAPYHRQIAAYRSVAAHDDAPEGHWSYPDKLALCHSYPFNGCLVPMFRHWALGERPQAIEGYVPVAEYRDPNLAANKRMKYYSKLDPFTLKELVDFVKQSRKSGIDVVFCIGPYYLGGTDFKLWTVEWDYLRITRQLAKVLKVPLIDFNVLSYVELRDPRNYTDGDHLNQRGAEFFSKQVAWHLAELKKFQAAGRFFASPYYPQIDPKDYLLAIE